MVPFAGYEMPVQYAAGVLKEHLHTRAAAGLFDVSHMGQIALRPKSGRVEDAALRAGAAGAAGHPRRAAGPAALCQFTNDAGGILDDLMVANFGEPSVSGRQRRLQGRGRGASARAACRTFARSSRFPTAR